MFKKLSPCVGGLRTHRVTQASGSRRCAWKYAKKNGARDGLSGGRFLSHAPFQAQETSSSLLNAFLKFASLVYVRLQHRLQTEISLRFIHLFIEK